MKNIKNKRGITFLILVFTIAIAVIIVSTITIAFSHVLDSTNKKEYANEINTVQKVIDQYKFLNNKYPVYEADLKYSLFNFPMYEKRQFVDEEGYDDNEVILKEINLFEAGIDNVTRGVKRKSESLDTYAVSEKTGRVYYLKGEKYDDVTYYTLTPELKESLDI